VSILYSELGEKVAEIVEGEDWLNVEKKFFFGENYNIIG